MTAAKTKAKTAAKIKASEVTSKLSAAGFSASQIKALMEIFKAA